MQTVSQKSIMSRVLGIVVVMLLVLTFALVGCSSNNNAQSSNQQAAPAAEQKAPETMTVNMTVTDLDGNVLYDDAVEVEPEATILTVLEQSGVDYTNEPTSFGAYITSLAGVAGTATSGWTYTLNDEQVMSAADQQAVADGDTVAWQLAEW